MIFYQVKKCSMLIVCALAWKSLQSQQSDRKTDPVIVKIHWMQIGEKFLKLVCLKQWFC